MRLEEAELRARLLLYLSGHMTLAQFRDWFTPIIWDLDAAQEDLGIAEVIDLLIMEYLSGDWSEEGLREALHRLCTQKPAHSL